MQVKITKNQILEISGKKGLQLYNSILYIQVNS